MNQSIARDRNNGIILAHLQLILHNLLRMVAVLRLLQLDVEVAQIEELLGSRPDPRPESAATERVQQGEHLPLVRQVVRDAPIAAVSDLGDADVPLGRRLLVGTDELEVVQGARVRHYLFAAAGAQAAASTGGLLHSFEWFVEYVDAHQAGIGFINLGAYHVPESVGLDVGPRLVFFGEHSKVDCIVIKYPDLALEVLIDILIISSLAFIVQKL